MRKKQMKKQKNNQGITLIALVITIIVLLILAGVTFLTLTGENGIINKSKKAKEETHKKEATEILKLKMTDCQMESIGQKGEYPTLAYLAAFLKNDGEIEYVQEQSKPIATLDETPYIGWDKIYTKLSKYPYEFEINNSFEVAVNGEQVAIPAGYMKIPTESLDITENGTQIDVTNYAKVNVNVPNTIPDNYMEKPTQENVKITEKAKDIDVTNYKSIDTTGLYTESEAATRKGVSWNEGSFSVTTSSIVNLEVGFVPSFICIVNSSNGNCASYKSSISTTKQNNVGTIRDLGVRTDGGSSIVSVGTTVQFQAKDNSSWYWIAIK